MNKRDSSHNIGWRKTATTDNHLRLIFTVLLLLGTCGFSANAQDAAFTVEVRQRQNNQPLLGTNVSISDGTRCSTTAVDSQGRAVFPRPTANLTVRVFATKPGFVTFSQSVTLTGANQLFQILLSEGSGGATLEGLNCRATTPVLTIVRPIEINTFEIESPGDQTITNPNLTLRATFSRNPAFYRVSEKRDFSDAQWQPFTANTPMTFRLNPTTQFGTRNIFLQVKPTTENASLSRIAADGVILKPTRLKTYTLTGDDLRNFEAAARERGYRFSFSAPRTNLCPGNLKVDMEDLLKRKRKSNRLIGEDSASFTVFQGADFLPFWTLKNISISHIDFPSSRPSASGGVFLSQPATEVFFRVENPNPIANNLQTSERIVRMIRRFYDMEPVAVLNVLPIICIDRPSPLPSITSLTFEGPDGLRPIDAFQPRNERR